MNVKQGLKEKNRLVEELKNLLQIASSQNSIEDGNPRHYSVRTILEEATAKAKELAVLKARIHAANAPVYEKIFMLSELKNFVKEVKSLPVEEGKVYERYGSTFQNKTVEINVKELREIISEKEKEIDRLQDELDLHNLTVQI